MKKIDELMLERRSARQFDTEYQIPSEDLQTLLNAIRMTPSSLGLLTQRLIVLTDPKTKSDLAPLFYNQQNFITANVFLIFIGSTVEGLPKRIQSTLDRKFGVGVESDLKTILTKNVGKYLLDEHVTEKNKLEWTIKQSFISVGVATAAATSLNIDTCIMEGYDANKVQEYLIKNNIIEKDEYPYISMACGKMVKFSGEKLRLENDEFIILK